MGTRTDHEQAIARADEWLNWQGETIDDLIGRHTEAAEKEQKRGGPEGAFGASLNWTRVRRLTEAKEQGFGQGRPFPSKRPKKAI